MHSDSKTRNQFLRGAALPTSVRNLRQPRAGWLLPGPRVPCSWLCQQHRHIAASDALILQLGTHHPDCPYSLQVLTYHPNNEQHLIFFLCCR